jgi:hypothetical protein
MGRKKLCRGCGVVRSLEEFAFKNSRTGQRHSRCKECGRRTSREHYLVHHAAYIERNRRNNPRHRTRNATAVLGYLQAHPCITCGESDPIVLEFNHTDPSTKSANISDLIRFGCYSIAYSTKSRSANLCAQTVISGIHRWADQHTTGVLRLRYKPRVCRCSEPRRMRAITDSHCISSRMRHASTAANRIG